MLCLKQTLYSIDKDHQLRYVKAWALKAAEFTNNLSKTHMIHRVTLMKTIYITRNRNA